MIDLGVGDGVYASLAVGVDAASLNPYAHIASSPDTARLDDQGLPDIHLSVPDDDPVLKEIRSGGVHRGGQGRWMLGVDHKAELLARAAATGAFRNLVLQDFNDPELALHGFEPVDLTFSNCLYWAHNPAGVLRAIRTWASDGGQVWLSLMLDNYAEHLIWTTMSDFPTLRPALDRGRHSHYAVSWNADRWLETVCGAGFEVFDYKFAASPSLVTANEWLDLREVGLSVYCPDDVIGRAV